MEAFCVSNIGIGLDWIGGSLPLVESLQVRKISTVLFKSGWNPSRDEWDKMNGCYLLAMWRKSFIFERTTIKVVIGNG
jgi:hypothetical protein